MRTPIGIAALAAAALTLAACSPPNENPSPESTGATATTATETTAETTTVADDASVVLEEGVVRAKGTDNDMTAIFGTLVNTTDEEINVSGFTADLDADAFELHEVVNGVMQEKQDGFTIPAGGEHELAAGGDHLMIMGHPDEIPAGDTVTLTLLLADGGEIDLGSVPVRTMAAGEENYGEDGELTGGSAADHGGGDGHAAH